MATDFEKLSEKELDALLLGQSSDFDTMDEAEIDRLLLGQAPAPPKDEIIQEAHPIFQGPRGILKRGILKNFATTPEDIVNTIKKDNPELEVKLSDEGQVILRSPNEEKFRVLDPSGFDIQDISDVGVDLLSGAAETTAGALGAAAGLPFGGVGAVPGFIGASAATGATTDALRQVVGQALGVEQEFDPASVGLSALFAGGGAALFGAGSGAVKGAGKQAIKEGTEKFIESGILPNLGKKTLSKAGELFTGVKSELFERVADNPQKFKQIDTVGIENYTDEVMNGLLDRIEASISQKGQAIDEFVTNSGKKVDVSGAINTAQNIIKKIDEKEVVTEAEEQFKNELKSQLDKAFNVINKAPAETEEVVVKGLLGEPVKQTIQKPLDFTNLDAGVAQSIKRGLDDIIDFATDPKNPKLSSFNKKIQSNLKTVRNDLKTRIEDAIPGAKELNEEFREEIANRKFVVNNFSNNKSAEGVRDFTEKGFNKLRQIGNERKTHLANRLQELDKSYGTNVSEASKDIGAFGLYKTTALLPRSIEGTTSTSRSIIATGLGGFAGSAIGESPESRVLGGVLGAALLGNPRIFRNAVRAAETTRQGAAQDIPLVFRNLSQELLRREQQKAQ